MVKKTKKSDSEIWEDSMETNTKIDDFKTKGGKAKKTIPKAKLVQSKTIKNPLTDKVDKLEAKIKKLEKSNKELEEKVRKCISEIRNLKHNGAPLIISK
jgi:seryl-tRNA synthetase